MQTEEHRYMTEEMTEEDSGPETQDCGMLIKMISDQIESNGNRMLNRQNLTLTQFRYLLYLQAKKPEPVLFKELEKHFQTSQPTVHGVLGRLEEKQLIAMASAGYGRAKIVRLTPKGSEIVQEAGRHRAQEEQNLLGALDEEEKERFHDMLVRINRHLAEISGTG
ncbi:MAG: MarR family winged helix-turn-helix transcriptional regulator [Lachnospiraceae bacterium]|jgi:DNA-binding MarR family transcriptional regulator